MSVETWAGLRLIIIVVTVDITAVHLDEVIDQLREGGFLGLSAGISRISRLKPPANVADTN